ncbi:hypothetical protein [Brevundimonas sp.]|uniref:hypothetical protein n=1 Tax=Brevundimonas sp. TaxID=1871086 RepID=UPI00289C2AD2|nr:hypothetical protein [Brevundimonas sp.]
MLVQPGYLMAAPDAGGAPARTEAEFDAHIATLAAQGVATWAGAFVGSGAFRTTAAAATGAMFGSSWLDRFYAASAVARAVQHAMPSLVVFNALAANGQQVFMRIVADAPVLVWNSTDRNGYVSLSEDDGVADAAYVCTEYLRWDRVLGKAFRGRPSIGAAEMEYVWP